MNGTVSLCYKVFFIIQSPGRLSPGFARAEFYQLISLVFTLTRF